MSVMVISSGWAYDPAKVRGSLLSASGENSLLTSQSLHWEGKKTLSSFGHHGLWLWIQKLLGIFVTMREASQRMRATFGKGHSCKGSLENRVRATGFGQPWGLATTLSTSGLPHASNTFPYYWSLVMSSSLSWAVGSTSNWYNKQLYQYYLWTISPSQDN